MRVSVVLVMVLLAVLAPVLVIAATLAV